MPRSRATDGPHCTVCTGGSVHGPVHDHHSERLTSTTERHHAPRKIRLIETASSRLRSRVACRKRGTGPSERVWRSALLWERVGAPHLTALLHYREPFPSVRFCGGIKVPAPAHVGETTRSI